MITQQTVFVTMNYDNNPLPPEEGRMRAIQAFPIDNIQEKSDESLFPDTDYNLVDAGRMHA